MFWLKENLILMKKCWRSVPLVFNWTKLHKYWNYLLQNWYFKSLESLSSYFDFTFVFLFYLDFFSISCFCLIQLRSYSGFLPNFYSLPEGQLISKCLLGFDQKTNENVLRISALASKKRLNQQFYHTKYVK